MNIKKSLVIIFWIHPFIIHEKRYTTIICQNVDKLRVHFLNFYIVWIQNIMNEINYLPYKLILLDSDDYQTNYVLAI